MKTINKFLIIATLLISIVSCKKNNTINSNGESYIRFSVNGTPVEYKGNNVLCMIVDPDDGDPVLSVTAYSSSAVLGTFIMSIDDASLAEGSTYELPSRINIFEFNLDKTLPDDGGTLTMYSGGRSGTLTVTKIKQVATTPYPTYAISGTFNGTAYNNDREAFVITNGQFYDRRVD